MARTAITFRTSGNFRTTTALLQKQKQLKILQILEKYGTKGVLALKDATPVASGKTRDSWFYTVGSKDGSYWIDFHNSNLVEGIPVIILIQYGHATRNGGYVPGNDVVNKAIDAIFEQIKNDVWKEVTSL